MSARAVTAALVGSAAILAVAWNVGQSEEAMVTAPIPLPPPVGSKNADVPGTPELTVTAALARRPPAVFETDRVSTGVTVRTKYGPMQVRITMRAGRLVRVWALRLTDRYGRSVRTSTAVVPILERRSIAAGSADIVGVTGATYTSDGYRRSLQSAIDRAGG